MKRLLLLPILMLFSALHAQDYCKKLVKMVTEENTMFSYTTPYDEKSIPCIRAERSYSTDPSNADVEKFFITLETPCKFEDILVKTDSSETEKVETKVVIEFEDHSVLQDDSAQIVHDNSAGDGTAKRIGYFNVTGDNIKQFTSKKIVKITLAVGAKDVPADIATPMMQYLQCLWDVKK